MPVEVITNLDYLIDELRFQIGDTTVGSYRYIDSWLRTTLVSAVKASSRWLNDKYILTEEYNVYRNPNIAFEFDSPPIIEHRDERVIILLASIIIKQGSLQNAAWDVSSWKDREISYSNIESGKQLEKSILRDWEELTSLVKIPVKRLARTIKNTLPGFLDNEYERNTKY